MFLCYLTEGNKTDQFFYILVQQMMKNHAFKHTEQQQRECGETERVGMDYNADIIIPTEP
jgi:hypothetical protein